MTTSSKTTSQTQASQSDPWDQAQPLLDKLLGSYGGQSTDVTGGQQSALNNLATSASGIPNFGDTASGAISNLFNSSTQPQVGMLNGAYSTLQNNLNPVATASLDPYQTPGFSDAIKTMGNDITNQVKSQYAASGRDPSGAGSFAGSLGRGISQGVAPAIAAQYNANVNNLTGANNALFNGANTTANGITGLNQTQLQNGIAGLAGASALPGIYTAPGSAQLGAANAQYGQSYSNLAQLLTPSVGLAGLGSQSTGTAQGTQTSTPSWLDSIKSGLGLAGTGASAIGSLLALSDERAKEDIAPVGKLADGQNVYSYRYKGSTVPQIGLLAQEVEHHEPDAVHDVGGLKAVNYEHATRKARHIAARGNVGYLGMKKAA